MNPTDAPSMAPPFCSSQLAFHTCSACMHISNRIIYCTFFCPIRVWYWCHLMYLEDLESSIIRYWNLDRIIVEYLPYFQYFSMCKSLIDIYSQYMVNHWWTELFHSGPEWQKAHFLPLFQQKSFSLWKVGRHSSQGFNNNREREREKRRQLDMSFKKKKKLHDQKLYNNDSNKGFPKNILN